MSLLETIHTYFGPTMASIGGIISIVLLLKNNLKPNPWLFDRSGKAYKNKDKFSYHVALSIWIMLAAFLVSLPFLTYFRDHPFK